MNLGDKLKKFRKDRNMTQQQMADFLSMSRSTLSYYERGLYKGDINFLHMLENKTELPVTYWLDGDDFELTAFDTLEYFINYLINSRKLNDDLTLPPQYKDDIMGLLQEYIKQKAIEIYKKDTN